MRCRCSFYLGVKHPRIGGDGPERPTVLVVGEGPGEQEDTRGRAFVGPTGKLLRATTARAVSGRSISVRYTNATRCFSMENSPRLAMAPCRVFLEREIEATAPERIIALGAVAMESLFGESLSVMNYVGAWRRETFGDRKIPVQAQIHPTAALRNTSLRPEWQRQYVEALLRPPPTAWADQDALSIEYAKTVDEAVALLQACHKAKLIAYDTEYNPDNGAFLCLAIATDANTAFVLPKEIALHPRAKEAIAVLFATKKVRKAAHNWKFDAHVSVKALGVPPRTYIEDEWLDTASLAKVENSERDGRLECLEWQVGLGGHKQKLYDVLPSKTGRGYEKAYETHPRVLEWYCAVDALACWRLVPVFLNRLKRRGLSSAWEDVVGPVGPVLFDMETQGVKVDRDALGTLKTTVEAGKELTLSTIRSSHIVARLAASGKIPSVDEFNPNSSHHMRPLMFSPEGLGLKPLTTTSGGKSGVAQPSTDKNSRKHYADAHPVLGQINEFARLEKLQNTYVKGWGKRLTEDDTLHTSYRQDGARTLRFSSSNPNLQTVPRGVSEETRALRRLIVAHDEGESLLSVDFSQVELRKLAMDSGDPELIRCYLKRVDVHKRTAAEFGGYPINDVPKEARQKAKPIY